MTIQELLTTSPPLPQIGATDWGPDLNDCLNWLYEQVAANANSMQINRDQIEALEGQVSALEGRVAVLEAMGEHVFTSYGWKFSNAAPPAASGELRLNHNTPSLATLIDIRNIDGDGADRTPTFRAMHAGDLVRITDWDDANILHRYEVTAAPTVGTTNTTIPVTWTNGNGVLPTAGAAKINVGFLVTIVV